MSHQGFDSTFKEFKENFYSKIGDGSGLNVADINVLKIVLDGLKVQYTSRGKISHHFNRSLVGMYVYFLINIIRDLRKRETLRSKLINIKSAVYLAGFSDRTEQEGNQCFTRIFEDIGRDKFCFITTNEKNKNDSDVVFPDLIFDFSIFSAYNRRLLKELRTFLYSKEFTSLWNEKEREDIRTAAFLFYIRYVKLNSFLQKKKFKSLLLICHYHNEGFIHACRKNNIKVVELQHGLIAKEDIFYVIPEQVKLIIKKALFPDEIYVYGNYWKKVLLQGCEFGEADIKICGYYHYDKYKNSSDLTTPGDKKIILLTTQYSAENYFIDFVQNLSPQLDQNWVIYLKPHPFEDIKLYQPLESKFPNVKIVQGTLNEWIDRSEFLITIFSTTIFDALRRGKKAFSLNIPLYSDYVNTLVSVGASYLLNPDEDPVKKMTSFSHSDRIPQEFYVNFTPERSDSIYRSLNG